MTCRHPSELQAADAEVEAARAQLAAALEEPWDEQAATDAIAAAARRLRQAQVRQAATRLRVQMTDLVGPAHHADRFD